MRNYWLDKKEKIDLVSRKITLDRVKDNTDLFKIGRIMTEKHEMLWPLASNDQCGMGLPTSEQIIPSIGSDVLVVDGKYYIGNVPGVEEITPDEEYEVSMQGWVELPS